MTESIAEKKRNLWPLWIGLIAVAAIVMVTVFAGVVLFAISFLREPYVGAPLRESVLSDTSLFTLAEEATDELCQEVNPCDEAWRTNLGVYRAYSSKGWAEQARYVIGGDVVQNGRVLLDFNGYDLSADERLLAIDHLFVGRDWG